MTNATRTLKAGWRVYSKRCGKVSGFDGVVVEPRGNGFQILDPQSGKVYQRDHYDLIATEAKPQTQVSDHQ